MKSEYISITEFSKRAGISRQKIYRKLSTDLKKWTKTDNGKTVINSKALELFCDAESVTKSVCMDTQTDNSKMLDFLMKQLEEKDKQIEKLQESLDHSQQLQAIAQKKIELLEQKKEEPDSPAEPSAKSAEEETEYIDVEVREVALREDLQSVLQRMPERPLTDDFEQIHKFKMAKMKFLSELTDRELVLMGYRPSQRPYMKVAALFGKDESNWDILKPSFLD